MPVREARCGHLRNAYVSTELSPGETMPPGREVPASICGLVEQYGVQIVRCQPVASTDERTRRRRLHFGDYLFPVSVLVVHEGRFVIVRYADDPPPGGWTVPGGYTEPGEAIEAAAHREVKEECGLVVDLQRPLGIVATEVTSPTEGTLDYYLTIFLAHSLTGELEPEDREEIDQVRLASFEEIEQLAADGHFPSINPNLDVAIVEFLRRAASARFPR